MSTLPYRITDELGAVLGSVTFDRAALLLALNAIDAPPRPPPVHRHLLNPGDDPAELLAQIPAPAAGTLMEDLDTLWLADGTHPYPIHLTKRVNVRAVPGARPVVSGWRTGLPWEHYSGNVYRLSWERGLMGLSHHAVTNAAFLAAVDGPARLAAHNAATAPELVTYAGEPLRRVSLSQLTSQPAPLTMALDEKFGWLYIVMPDSLSAEELYQEIDVAILPRLFSAADGVAGITVEGIAFTGAANTHKQGAFTLHSDGNRLRNLSVDMVNSLGYSIRGIGLTMENVNAADCGQMGHWMKVQKSTVTNCGHAGSNWRGSDAGWHASNKWEQSIDNIVRGWWASDTNGCGLWLDIGNHGNTFEALDLIGCGKNALMVEHYAERNTFSGRIRGTRPIGRWAGADIQIQSNVKDNTFDGMEIVGDMVPHWLIYKTKEGRGPSGPNEFRNITTGGRMAKFEPAAHEKDEFQNVA